MTKVSRKTSAGSRLILAALMAVVLGVPGHAADKRKIAVEPQIEIQRAIAGAADRLELADKLRMLSQEIPASACHLSNGIAPENSLYRLEKAKKYFPRYLNALEFGDAVYNISDAEARQATLENIASIHTHWVKVDEAIYQLTYLPQDVDAFSQLTTETDALVHLTNLLMSELEAEYSNPFELTALDAKLLDIASRQTALTQHISKTSCEIWSGPRSEDRVRELSQSIALFERGIRALRDGLPELGIIPAPTPEIETSLAALVTDWASVREMLGQVMVGDADKDQITVLYGRLNKNGAEMTRIVNLYTAYAKRIY